MPYAIVGIVLFVLWLYCLVDAIMCPESEVRNLPKIAWVLIVVLVPTIGSVLWLVAGRPHGPVGRGRQASNTSYGEYDRPGRHVAANPDDDAEFLRRCRERAEEQRREARRQQREQDDR